MSAMLEQAIVDAAALKDAAIQSAEQSLVEKYSGEIKETVEKLLEQPELGMPLGGDDPMAMGGDDPAAPGGGEPPEEDPGIYQAKDAPADADKKEMSALAAALAKKPGEGYAFSSRHAGDDNLEIDINVDALLREVQESEESEEVEIDRDSLEEIVRFDYELNSITMGDGYKAHGKATNTVDDTYEVAEVMVDFAKYKEKKETETKSLKEQNLKFIKLVKQLIKKKSKLLEAISFMKEKFDEVQLMNAKLFYTNRALTDASMNERQKLQIVESVEKADSIQEVKIVCEALQGAVGSTKNKKPNSLSEVVSMRSSSSMILHSSNEEDKKEETNNVFAERMKRLAGLK